MKKYVEKAMENVAEKKQLTFEVIEKENPEEQQAKKKILSKPQATYWICVKGHAFKHKYRVHPDTESAQDKENQEKLFKDTLKEFNELEDNTNMLAKLYYSFKLIVHHLKTRNDKKEKK